MTTDVIAQTSGKANPADAKRRETSKIALVLSAGAPHSPLMAGALSAIHAEFAKRDPDVKDLEGPNNKNYFDVIYTSGAGALIGLLLAAPKNKDPQKALRSVVDMGISDPIYSVLPVNFKAFSKPGPFTRPIQQMAQLFKLGAFPISRIDNPVSPLGHWFNFWVGVRQQWRDAAGGGVKRLYNDLIDFSAAAITPTTLNWWSQGICDPLPFLDDIIDFDELNRKRDDFFLNYMTPKTMLDEERKAEEEHHRLQAAKSNQRVKKRSSTGKLMQLVAAQAITPKHVRAAFAFPFIYTPVKFDDGTSGDTLAFEGANWEPISFGNLFDVEKKVQGFKTVVVVDILTVLQPFLMREPQNLWDAFGLFIMMPVVAHAKRELSRLEDELDSQLIHPRGFKYCKVEFKIPDGRAANLLDWSYSNMSALFDLGVAAGKQFCKDYDDDLFFNYPLPK